MPKYYAETSGLSRDITIYRDCITVDCLTADGDSLDAKDEVLSRSGYSRPGHWVYTMQLPVGRYGAQIERL